MASNELDLREQQVREAAICGLCEKPFGSTGLPLFWRVRMVRYGVDMGAVRAQDGLAAMLGGHAGLAQVIGPDRVMARALENVEITVCETCAMERPVLVGHVGLLAAEAAAAKEATDASV